MNMTLLADVSTRIQNTHLTERLPTLSAAIMRGLTSTTLPPLNNVWGKRSFDTTPTSTTTMLSQAISSGTTCHMCEISLVDKAKFYAHLLDHSVGKHYRCLCCNKMFTQLINMKSHFKAVHLRIKYPCSICGVQLSSQTNLSHHKTKTHAPIGKKGKMIHCTLCDTYMRGDLARHQATKHCKKKSVNFQLTKTSSAAMNKSTATNKSTAMNKSTVSTVMDSDETPEDDEDLVICSDEEY
jgi:hypothetical protein